jgi:redox-sensitive bicupin YhaK (pirin superfamily)
VEDAHIRPMMANQVLESLPSRHIPYSLVDPYAITGCFNGFVHTLDGEAMFGSNRSRAKRGQIAVLGPGGVLAVEDAQPGTRFMLMAGKPYGETPIYNGPYVD